MSDLSNQLFAAYSTTRSRMILLAENLRPSDLGTVVPACPLWTARDLIAHVVSMPAAIAKGDLPSGATDQWLQSLVEARRDQKLGELTGEWLSLDSAIRSILHGQGELLFVDLAIHEHDLRGAVGAPDHTALEVEEILSRTLTLFAAPLRCANLGAIEVRHDNQVWRSHDSESGWTLLVTPWEAVRALNSRRTTDELWALPQRGDLDHYLAILDAHLPLPTTSLNES